MNTVTDRNFGLLIAYLVPGFTALLGVSYFSDTVKAWLTGAGPDGPTIGGFLYVTLAAVAAGLTVSTVRWALIDTLHHATGIRKPQWDFHQLSQHVSAFHVVVEHQYRYYQFYSNMVVAIVFVMACRLPMGLTSVADAGLVALICIFGAGSRDTLREFYERTLMVLGTKDDGQSTTTQGPTS